MKLTPRLALFVAATTTAATGALAADKYQEIEISWPDDVTLERIGDVEGLEVMRIIPDESMRFLSTPDMTAALESSGVAVTIVHGDLEAHYARRNDGELNRGGGDFGLLYTRDEVIAEMDALRASYPNIITDKISIGTSVEGRDIWAMKISDNPEIEEADEPEVLFDALHHAREAITPSVLIGYMRYLCENYGTDAEATFVVDNRQTWFVPIVNPDGYLYNESLDSAGGGLWRKNRRDNPGTSCDGVDLNRNYSFEFGGPGSDSDPCSDIYRGPAPFSEPESSAIRDLLINHEFVTHNSYHSVVGLILYPWGYTTSTPPDLATLGDIAVGMARDSGYPHGPAGSALYVASGVTFDYSYGNTTDKPRAFAYTTEVGGSGFWPADSEVAGLVAENIYSNIYLSLVAGSYVIVTDTEVTGGDGNGRLDAGETANVVVDLENVGVIDDAIGVSVVLTSDDPYVSFVSASSSVADLGAGAAGDNGSNPFVVSVDPATPDGHAFDFVVETSWDDGSSSEAGRLIVGEAPAFASFDFEADAGGWTVDPASTASTGDWVRIDPNQTTYQPEDDTTPAPGIYAMITAQNVGVGNNDVDNGVAGMLSPVLDFSAEASVEMTLNYFFGQRDSGDDSADFFRIDLSNDGGATYPANLLLLGDSSSPPIWESFSARLDDYLPLTDSMRIRVQASDGVTGGDIIEAGIDDVAFVAGDGNSAPSAPALVSPADGATVDADANLIASNATDPEGSTLSYAFTVYDDALLTSTVRSVTGVVEGASETSWTIDPPLADGTYTWRAYADDGSLRGDYSETRSFTVGEIVSVPDAAFGTVLSAPAPNPARAGSRVRFVLNDAARVRADVFDVTGRHVRNLERGRLPAGPNVAAWDGRDRNGRSVAPGDYFIQVVVDGRVFNRKVVVID